MNSKSLDNIKNAISYLEVNNLNIEGMTLTTSYYTEVVFGIGRDILDDEDYRTIKRIFGPLKVIDSYEFKDVKGEATLPNGLIISLRVTRVLECTKLDQDEVNAMTEEDWQTYRARAKEGQVQVIKCAETSEADRTF